MSSERARTGERGQVAGIEVLPFGLLVFVTGTLLLANLWGVVDARFAADAAARESARWVVERAGADTPPDGLRAGAAEIAAATIREHGRRRPPEVTVAPPDATFRRCERISVTVRTEVPAIAVPFVGGFGRAFDVVATHSELIDPTRSGVEGQADCLR